MTHIPGKLAFGLCAVMGALTGCHKSTAPAATPAGEATQGVEDAGPPEGPACGKLNCAPGEVCCNASCSICTPPDGMCTQQICEEDAPSAVPGGQGGNSPAPGETPPASGAVNGEPVDESKPSCANVRCAAGTHCEMVQVQCVRAPCDPQPQCRPDTAPTQGGAGVSCGKNTCAPGQTCCNASCGICTDPGKGCIKMFCQDGQLPH
ncbi:MAG: hypothetical protein QM778_03955 [Myxococcales bacterium]